MATAAHAPLLSRADTCWVSLPLRALSPCWFIRSVRTMAGSAACTGSTRCQPTRRTRSSCWRWTSSATAASTQRKKTWSVLFLVCAVLPSQPDIDMHVCWPNCCFFGVAVTALGSTSSSVSMSPCSMRPCCLAAQVLNPVLQQCRGGSAVMLSQRQHQHLEYLLQQLLDTPATDPSFDPLLHQYMTVSCPGSSIAGWQQKVLRLCGLTVLLLPLLAITRACCCCYLLRRILRRTCRKRSLYCFRPFKNSCPGSS